MIYIKQGEPNEGLITKLVIEGKQVVAEVFEARTYSGYEKYAVILPPHTEHASATVKRIA